MRCAGHTARRRGTSGTAEPLGRGDVLWLRERSGGERGASPEGPVTGTVCSTMWHRTQRPTALRVTGGITPRVARWPGAGGARRPHGRRAPRPWWGAGAPRTRRRWPSCGPPGRAPRVHSTGRHGSRRRCATDGLQAACRWTALRTKASPHRRQAPRPAGHGARRAPVEPRPRPDGSRAPVPWPHGAVQRCRSPAARSRRADARPPVAAAGGQVPPGSAGKRACENRNPSSAEGKTVAEPAGAPVGRSCGGAGTKGGSLPLPWRQPPHRPRAALA
jgi:hypothetical protein